jgi:mono/diheme cytochrome c family protein
MEGRTMLRSLALVAAALLLVSVAAEAQDDTKLDGNMAAKGERLFRTYCGSCHGKDAKGDGPLAKELKATPADLTKLSANNGGTFPFDMVVNTIENGRRVRGHGTTDMPAWGDAFKMTAQDPNEPKLMMRELAHYLWSIQPKQ